MEERLEDCGGGECRCDDCKAELLAFSYDLDRHYPVQLEDE